jgi:hypothetical protein
MADNTHGFNAKEIIAKIGFHQKKMEVTWNLGKAVTTTYLINVLYSTSLHTRSCVCCCPPIEGSCPLTWYQPQGEFTPPMPATSYPRQTPHQPLPEEMLADGCPLGNVDGRVTANFVGKIPWSPSDILLGASLCDT